MAPEPSVSNSVMVTAAKTCRPASGSSTAPPPAPSAAVSSSCRSDTIFCCSVRISSRPVRSPTCANRGYSWPPKFRWLIRPSGVRSNSAPYVSSSHTRCGASWACSSAIRGMLRNLPPRMVSRTCTCQLSFELTLPIDAATPRSAITVCALPNSDLQMIATRRPSPRAGMAARRPAPPAPTIRTSYRCSSWSEIRSGPPWLSEEAKIADGAVRQQGDVQIGDDQPAQRHPGQQHVPAVQFRDLLPHPVSAGVTREMLELAAHDVPAGMAGQGVQPDQCGVDQQDDGAEANVAPLALRVPESQDRVVGQDDPEDHREEPEVPVDVLQDQRETGLAGVPLVRLGDRAGRWGEPE